MSVDGVQIRLAEPKDREGIHVLCRQTDEHHLGLLPDVFRAFEGPSRSEDYFAKFTPEKRGAFFVAEANGALVGFLAIRDMEYPSLPMFQGRDHALIEELIIDLECRGLGIGSCLIETARQWAAEQGYESMQANVWSANRRARAFYIREGFESVTEKLELKVEEAEG